MPTDDDLANIEAFLQTLDPKTADQNSAIPTTGPNAPPDFKALT
jgi:hypothetical protein